MPSFTALREHYNLHPLEPAERVERQLRATCTHEAAHAVLDVLFGDEVRVEIAAVFRVTNRKAHWFGECLHRHTGGSGTALDADERRLASLAGLIGEYFTASPEATDEQVREWLTADAATFMSPEDAEGAAGYTEKHVTACARLVRSAWAQVSALAVELADAVQASPYHRARRAVVPTETGFAVFDPDSIPSGVVAMTLHYWSEEVA